MVVAVSDDISQLDLCEESIAAISKLLNGNPLTDEEKSTNKLMCVGENNKASRLPYSFTVGADRSKKKWAVPAQVSQNGPFAESRANLPIYEYRDNIIDAIDQNQVVVISGETGSGKTTQVPQYILEQYAAAKRPCRIICTQPRRLAATSIADRVSQERGDRLGQSVGYQIRLDSCVCPNTNLIFTTSGYLLRCLMGSNSGEIFSSVTHLLLDEVHEREKITDFLLIAIKDGLKLNPNVKIVLMSATLDSDVFCKYFNDCPVINVPGRTYDVDVVYLDHVLSMTSYMSKRMQVYMDQNDGPKELRRNHGPSNQPKSTQNGDAALPNGHVNDVENVIETAAAAVDASVAVPEDADVDFFDECLGQCLTSDEDNTFEQIYYLITDEEMPVDYIHTTVKRTALSIAAEKGFLSALSTLLEFGAKATSADSNGVTPLAYAIRNNHDDCVQLLQSYLEDDELAFEPQPTKVTGENECADNIDEVNEAKTVVVADDECKNAKRKFALTAYQMTAHNSHDLDHDLIFHVINYVHANQPADGSILVFLPGYDDIMKQKEHIESKMLDYQTYQLFVLHSGLNATKNSDQQRVFQRMPKGQRKIILSTNIAETSLTIDDVVYVIDSGRVKQQTYDSISDTTCLTSTWISQACAKQRAGRAGRTRNGHCYRIYANDHYDTFEKYTIPEILRVPLTDICLNAKILANKITIEEFLLKAVQPPPVLSIRQSINLLKRIDALDEEENITRLGVHLADLPVDAQLGKCIIYAILLQCVDPIVTIVSALSVKDPFNLPMGDEGRRIQAIKMNFARGSFSDHVMLLNTYNEWWRQKHTNDERQFSHDNMISNGNMEMIHGVRKLIMGHLKAIGIRLDDRSNKNYNQMPVIMACLTAGTYPNVCRLDGRTKRITTKHERKLLPHCSSVLRNRSSPNQLDPAVTNDVRAEFLIHGEKSRISYYSLIRNVSLVASINIAFFGGPINMSETNLWTMKIDSWNAEPKIGHFNVPSDDDDDIDDEDDGDGGGNGKHETTFIIDDWIRFKMNENEANLLLHFRHKFNGILDKFLRNPTEFRTDHKDQYTLDVLKRVICAETGQQMVDQHQDHESSPNNSTNGCALSSSSYYNSIQPEHRRGARKKNNNNNKKRKNKPNKPNIESNWRQGSSNFASPSTTASDSTEAGRMPSYRQPKNLHPTNHFRSSNTTSTAAAAGLSPMSRKFYPPVDTQQTNRSPATYNGYNNVSVPNVPLNPAQMDLMHGLFNQSLNQQSSVPRHYGREIMTRRHLPSTKYYVLTIESPQKLMHAVYSNQWKFNKPISEITNVERIFPNSTIIIFFYVQNKGAIFGAGQFTSTSSSHRNRNSSYNLKLQPEHPRPIRLVQRLFDAPVSFSIYLISFSSFTDIFK